MDNMSETVDKKHPRSNTCGMACDAAQLDQWITPVQNYSEQIILKKDRWHSYFSKVSKDWDFWIKRKLIDHQRSINTESWIILTFS